MRNNDYNEMFTKDFIVIHKCLICNRENLYECEALKCCIDKKTQYKYFCRSCKKDFNNENDAIYCCEK